jgi:hypothetical protein
LGFGPVVIVKVATGREGPPPDAPDIALAALVIEQREESVLHTIIIPQYVVEGAGKEIGIFICV